MGSDRGARAAAGAHPVLAGAVLALVLLAPVPLPAAAPERDEYFARIDRDGDGRVGLAEFQDYMSRGFRAMDRNRDGTLQDHELPTGVVLRRGQPRTLSALLANLERAFRRMDRDGSGQLREAELLAPPPAP